MLMLNAGSRRSSGNEFQVDGPATANDWRADSVRSIQRGTIIYTADQQIVGVGDQRPTMYQMHRASIPRTMLSFIVRRGVYPPNNQGAIPPTSSLSAPLPSPPSPSLHSARSGPLETSWVSGERCKLPQWGLGRPSRHRFWCNLKEKTHQQLLYGFLYTEIC